MFYSNWAAVTQATIIQTYPCRALIEDEGGDAFGTPK
jgi:hypothetical protein